MVSLPMTLACAPVAMVLPEAPLSPLPKPLALPEADPNFRLRDICAKLLPGLKRFNFKYASSSLPDGELPLLLHSPNNLAISPRNRSARL